MFLNDNECEMLLSVYQKVNLVVKSLAEDVLNGDESQPLTPEQHGMLKAYAGVIKHTRDEIECIARRLGRDVSYYLFDPTGTKLYSVGKREELDRCG